MEGRWDGREMGWKGDGMEGRWDGREMGGKKRDRVKRRKEVTKVFTYPARTSNILKTRAISAVDPHGAESLGCNN
jgi:hypothetical protein